MEKWKLVFDKLTISSEEKKNIFKYLEKPSIANIIYLCSILDIYKLEHEKIRFLIYNIKIFPLDLSLKVNLSEALYKNGFFNESWDVLIQEEKKLQTNIKAQKILFFCTIILEKSSLTKFYLENLRKKKSISDDVHKIIESLNEKGLVHTKSLLLKQTSAKSDNCNFILPWQKKNSMKQKERLHTSLCTIDKNTYEKIHHFENNLISLKNKATTCKVTDSEIEKNLCKQDEMLVYKLVLIDMIDNQICICKNLLKTYSHENQLVQPKKTKYSCR